MNRKYKQLLNRNNKVIVAAVLVGLLLVMLGVVIGALVVGGGTEPASDELNFTKDDGSETLEIEIVEMGEGPIASSGAMLTVQYVAKTIEGELLYDSSASGEELTITLDSARAPYALNRSLKGMTEGSKLIIKVPAEDAKGLELGEVEPETMPALLEVNLLVVEER